MLHHLHLKASFLSLLDKGFWALATGLLCTVVVSTAEATQLRIEPNGARLCGAPGEELSGVLRLTNPLDRPATLNLRTFDESACKEPTESHSPASWLKLETDAPLAFEPGETVLLPYSMQLPLEDNCSFYRARLSFGEQGKHYTSASGIRVQGRIAIYLFFETCSGRASPAGDQGATMDLEKPWVAQCLYINQEAILAVKNAKDLHLSKYVLELSVIRTT